ncbi:MAG TPA: hypothetical protein DEA90_13085 [Opitutae bacterium]|nr:hypothetical protein [Puniceicoccaceae bacterium]HBR95088.1 hypothetical protein [Opitutae bacterium]|tara:strand:- start:3072 stop:5081 length:2010 start_codon:yes stop_codon:yes gene_type:complete
MMRFNDRSPLLIAFVIATVLCAAVSLGLYLNEDWRQSTFALIEEVVDEEGEVVKKVKIEKPEPNREQVREIARNQEIKKREQLKENARKLRKTVVELEEVVEVRKASLQLPDIWDEMAKRANGLSEQAALLHYWRSKSSFLSRQPNVTRRITELRNSNEIHANTMRVLSLQTEVPDDDAWEALNEARQTVDSLLPVQEVLTAAYQTVVAQPADREQEKRLRYVNQRIDEFKTLQAESTQYLEDFENLLMKGGLEPTDSLALSPDEVPMETEALEDDSFTDILPSDEDFEEMETSELYESIQEMTQQLDEIYAENKATELAEFKQIPLEEAKEQVYAPETDIGPELSEQLSNNQPNTSEEFKAFNEALDQAVNSSERMSRQAENRLDAASGSKAAESQATQTAEQLKDALSKEATIKAKMAMAASNMGRSQGNLQDLRALMEESYHNQSGDRSGSDLGQAGLSNNYDATSFTANDRSGNNPSKISLSRSKTYANALPGRRFDMDSPRKGWIFIDTWYIIGPWKLPHSVKEFEPSLPPETEVDLDAKYEGMTHPGTKKPMNLQWRFIQSGSIRIKPPDERSGSVYFAYTEVFCESTMDVVVAVASDDRAKLWINDMVVFQDVGLSGWALDEGFRRVLLKPGYNKLLVRLENGPAVANFSVLMCPIDGIQEP